MPQQLDTSTELTTRREPPEGIEGRGFRQGLRNHEIRNFLLILRVVPIVNSLLFWLSLTVAYQVRGTVAPLVTYHICVFKGFFPLRSVMLPSFSQSQHLNTKRQVFIGPWQSACDKLIWPCALRIINSSGSADVPTHTGNAPKCSSECQTGA